MHVDEPNPNLVVWTVYYSGAVGNVPAENFRPTARGLHEYVATAPDELSVKPGEVIGITANHDGWVSAVNQSGTEGLVPTPYLEL